MSNRSASVDIAKFIAAIFVIGVHTRLLADISEIADFVLCDIVFRTAVPFFAVCSGFFLTKKLLKNSITSWEPIKTAAIKTLVLYVVWSFFYLLILMLSWYQKGIMTSTVVFGWFKSFLIGAPYYHLWYLAQLFWALLFFYPIVKFLNVRIQLLLAILLWIVGVYVSVYSEILDLGIIGHKFIHYYRLMGAFSGAIGRLLPLLLAGSLLARRAPIDLQDSWVMTGVTFVCLICEVFLIKRLGVTHFKYELFSLPFAYFFFSSVILTQVNININTMILAKSSMYIYLLHPVPIFFVRDLGLVKLSSNLLLFVISFIIALVLSLIIIFIKQSRACYTPRTCHIPLTFTRSKKE